MISGYLQANKPRKHSGLLKWRSRSPVERTAATLYQAYAHTVLGALRRISHLFFSVRLGTRDDCRNSPEICLANNCNSVMIGADFKP